jgi:hypothetical protein
MFSNSTHNMYAYCVLVFFLLLILVLITISLAQSFSMKVPMSEYHFMRLPGSQTNINGEIKVDVVVTYRYSSLKANKSPNHATIVALIKGLLNPDDAMPYNIAWGNVSRSIAERIYATEPVDGVCLQIIWQGQHSTVFTKGYIAPHLGTLSHANTPTTYDPNTPTASI